MRQSIPQLAAKIEGLAWIKDGIDGRNERRAAEGLIWLANEGFAEEGASLISEPWVVEGSNYAALTFPTVRHDTGSEVWTLNEALTRVFSYPVFKDGLSTQEAKTFTVASSADITRPLGARIADVDFAGLDIEERTISLPLAGETELTIIRTGTGGDYAMDGLEHSVHSIEEFMGYSFPRRQVIYFIDDRVIGWGNVQDTHVTIGADELGRNMFWRGGFPQTNREWILETIAHEASHYYWKGGPKWLNEGAAEFMQSIVADTLHGPLEMQGVLCPVPNIAAYQSQSAACFDSCPYVLGERLFRGLYRAMDDDTAFRLAFRRLYLHIRYDLPDSGCDKDKGVETACHVKEAFTTYAPEGKVDAVETEIARWFDGVGQPSVRVAVTGPDGQPQPFGAPDGTRSQVHLMFERPNGQEGYEVESIDGIFDMIMPPGTFAVEVRIPTYPSPRHVAWEFIGWYDGDGGLTTDPEKMGRMTIDPDGSQTFEIRLPADTDGLLCPPGSFRSSVTGSCTPE